MRVYSSSMNYMLAYCTLQPSKESNPVNVLVCDASGATGREMVRQALGHGRSVGALVRALIRGDQARQPCCVDWRRDGVRDGGAYRQGRRCRRERLGFRQFPRFGPGLDRRRPGHRSSHGACRGALARLLVDTRVRWPRYAAGFEDRYVVLSQVCCG